MSDLFVSYHRADKAEASALAQALSRQGWSVWWDQDIPPGKTFDEVIEQALNAAQCVIVLWSKESVRSDWVKAEAAEAARRRILIPVLIENVTIPFEFRRIHAANLSGWDGDARHHNFLELVTAIANITGQPRGEKLEPSQATVAQHLQKTRQENFIMKPPDREEVTSRKRTKLFISYSHYDTQWLERLRVHLKPLERDYDIDIWDDRKIRAGSKWREEIERAIRSAKVALLIISADFLASDFIANNELPPLLDAAEKEGAVILSLIVSPSRFTSTRSLSQFQAVNNPFRPLINMTKGEQEEVLVKVSEDIEIALRSPPF